MDNKKITLIFKLLKENKINEEEACQLLQTEKEYIYVPSTITIPPSYTNSPTTAPIDPSYYIGSFSTSGSSSVKSTGCCNSSCGCK